MILVVEILVKMVVMKINLIRVVILNIIVVVKKVVIIWGDDGDEDEVDGSNKEVSLNNVNVRDAKNKFDLGDVRNGGGDSNGGDDVRSGDGEFDSDNKDDGDVVGYGGVDFNIGKYVNCSVCKSNVDCREDTAGDDSNSNTDDSPQW